MRITSVSAHIVKVPLVMPFVIAAGTQNDYHGVFVKVTAGDLHGWGEAAPSKRVTGETEASVMKFVKKMAPRIKARPPSLDLVPTIFDARNGSGTAALDMAIHDLVGKIEGRPVRDMYAPGNRPKRTSIETSITISVGGLEATLERAQELIEKGATTLKMKIGTDPRRDIERVKAVRSMFPRVKIRLDGNQGYDEGQATYVLKELEPEGIQFIEQPIDKLYLGAMARVRKHVNIPIMADEALTDYKSLEKIIKKGAADMINIKLMKVGGIREGMRIAHRALEAGLGVQVGCMIETRVAITAGMHLALADESILYADLDGHLDLKEDVVTGGVTTRLGKDRISNAPGLGLDVTEKSLKKYCIKGSEF
jgi:L-alanine-DL-glutamate epimerase-like enolase superfamily enzyme